MSNPENGFGRTRGETGRLVSRRGVLSASVGVLAAGLIPVACTGSSPEDHDDRKRELAWLDPATFEVEDSAWKTYDADPDAKPNEQDSWRLIGGLMIPFEAYELQMGMLQAEGLNPQHAVAFKAGERVRIGIAREGDDPSFFGETNESNSYLLGARIGDNGLSATLGTYVASEGLYVGIKTDGLSPASLDQFLKDNSHATWA